MKSLNVGDTIEYDNPFSSNGKFSNRKYKLVLLDIHYFNKLYIKRARVLLTEKTYDLFIANNVPAFRTKFRKEVIEYNKHLYKK